MRGSPRLRWLIAISVLTSSFSNSLVTLYQPYFAQFSVSPGWIGAALSLGGLLAFVTQRYAYWVEKKLGRAGFLVVTIWPGIMYVLLALVALPGLLVPVFGLAYASMEARSPLLSAYKNEQIQSHNRATVLSLINMFTSLYVAVMTLIIGRVADISIAAAFAGLGGWIILFTLILRTDRVKVDFNVG